MHASGGKIALGRIRFGSPISAPDVGSALNELLEKRRIGEDSFYPVYIHTYIIRLDPSNPDSKRLI